MSAARIARLTPQRAILDKAKGQHFQGACGKYFEAKHKGTSLIETELGGISHPNQYFDESAKFHAPADGEAAAAARRGGGR